MYPGDHPGPDTYPGVLAASELTATSGIARGGVATILAPAIPPATLTATTALTRGGSAVVLTPAIAPAQVTATGTITRGGTATLTLPRVEAPTDPGATRVFVAEALSGNIVGEVRLAGQSRFTSRFGGGQADVRISVGHLTIRGTDDPDWPAIGRVVDWCQGGKYSLVVSQGTRTVGEWLIMRHVETTTGGDLRVSGVEWDGYPAMRSLQDEYAYTNLDQYTIARILLQDAYLRDQPTLNLAVPLPGLSGVLRDLHYEPHTAYYSDALDELAQAENGFDWRVRPILTWSGGDALRVDRVVDFGHPTLSRASSLVVDHDGPGARSGNAPLFERSYDFARAAAVVYGVGAGEGDKQPIVTVTNGAPGDGYLITSKHVSYPSVDNPKTLEALTRGEAAASADMRDPMRGQVLIEKLASWPRVGDEVTLDVEPTFSLPAGVNGQARLGEVTLTLDGHHASTVEILAADAPRFPYQRSVGQDLRDLYKGGRLGGGSKTTAASRLGNSSIRKGMGALAAIDLGQGPGPRALFGDLGDGKFGIGIDMDGDMTPVDELFKDARNYADGLSKRIDAIESDGDGRGWNTRQDRDIADGRRRMSENEAGDGLRGQQIGNLDQRADTKDMETLELRRRVKALEERAVAAEKAMREAERDIGNATKGIVTERTRSTRNMDDIKTERQRGDVLEVLYEEAKNDRAKQWANLDHTLVMAGVTQGVSNKASTDAQAALSAVSGAAADATAALSAASAAQSAATAAQSTADGAQSTATTAQGTANTAQSTATGAQSTATAAQSAATAAQNEITGARGGYGSLDGRLDNIEAQITNAVNSIMTALTAVNDRVNQLRDIHGLPPVNM